jgi:hypothetical protein
MVWSDRFVSNKVAQTTKRTLGGVPIVFAVPLYRGSAITLVATEEYGWLSGTVVQQLVAMADSPGAVYSLEVETYTYSVVFRHDDPPAVEMSPLIPRTNQASGDFFIGQIKLLYV